MLASVKILKRVLLALAILIAVALVVGLFLPGNYRVERSVAIRAKPEAIFPHLNTLKTWPEWTAWTVERYPDMKVSFSGPESGVGAVYSWEGKSSGAGTLKLTRSDPASGIGFELDFEHGKYVSSGSISLQPQGETTTVTWSNGGDLGRSPMSRWFGLMMDKMMGPDFESGLNKLKTKVEAKP